MPAEFWYGQAQPPGPIHCDGSRVAWTKGGMTNPHHGRIRHPDCWHCHQPMGCDQCVSTRETLCKRCAVYVYPEHLARLGPLLNTPQMLSRRGGLRAPQVADYPPAFQRVYHRAHSVCDLACWCQSTSRDMAVVREFLAAPGVDMPPAGDESARRDLLRSQVQQLATEHMETP
jgi:hypothetical protein